MNNNNNKLDKIPSLIPSVVFVGKTNAGKSSLINALTNQDISIVSDIAGTTTDEVVKRFELLDAGPINIIDTAGLNDDSQLGQQRINKTKKAMKRATLLVYLCAVNEVLDLTEYEKYPDHKLLVFTKIDLLDKTELDNLKQLHPQALFVSNFNEEDITKFKVALTKLISISEKHLLENITLQFNKIVHVIPIDSEAPKGRLILPQMQLIRECLDFDIISIVLKESELEQYLIDNDDIGLIVTDSQAFKIVSEINNNRFPLTSYSILQANQKGDLEYFVKSIPFLHYLKEGAHILIMESCSHNASHEDIGRIKIPKMLKEIIKKDFTYDFTMAHDFPDDLKKYDYIVHCGSCMLSSTIMKKRVRQAQELHLPMSNYGLIIAYYNGILNEAINIFGIERVN
ncbi:[FeFe] hydrogenase H-cluster maturation GTPase HydF [Erysipelotrichaceae bacterium OttesenSCG-928-M19]|nr:[FeFe] hydrogenase H-cluster maturation GTPase HydF [Erysipelotrichaceae bacterium OttesenSCG-928-M19]